MWMERLRDWDLRAWKKEIFWRSKARIKRIVFRAHHQNVFITFFRCRLTLDSDVVRVRVTFPSIYLLLMNMMFG